ncbi:MAG: permease [Herbaspirillum sp.]|nr:permease [Herbaspirillum sp.]
MLLTGITLGAAVGAILGLTGAGGGILAVPALMIGMGYSLADARPISLIAVGVAALLGCADGWRRGLVRYRAALWIALAGALCAPLGIWFAQRLPQRLSGALFGLLMVYMALRMASQGLGKTAVSSPDADDRDCHCRMNTGTGRLRWTRRCARWLFAVGAAAGLLTGMFGVGGGFVIVPSLRRVSNVGMHSGVATSLMVIATVSAVSSAEMFAGGTGMAAQGWWFVGAAAAGTLAGRRLSTRIAPRPLQCVFAGVMLLAAGMLMFKLFPEYLR